MSKRGFTEFDASAVIAGSGRPFDTRLNALLDAADFDQFVEGQCARFYAPVRGRPRRLHVGAATAGGGGLAQGQDDRG